ncbi:uncharacterized protein FIBRA_03194 [Fibroporia radiculosa]|uniref:YCII-related domain-containing protein n=1 Tax=Fibroporia radiculosa TaxID=599839 RepID=J4I9H0_9APHY|nr:uncharacterized protein FIBRA_03194 [Fibroporia radiculosa]CCM01146.1 predicted protein [Fibroporia radiculosa]
MPAPGNFTFILYAPDMTNPEAFKSRMDVRAQHLQGAREHHHEGILKIGGAILSPDAEKKMIGSIIIFEADSIETVRKTVEEDVYYKEGVWDKEKLQIYPYQSPHL